MHEAAGTSFLFWPLTAALSEVPLEDRQQPLLFHARTADFTDVTVQATITYRVVDPPLAATRIDFSIDPRAGRWNATPLDTIGGLLTELAQQPALDALAALPLEQALTTGMTVVRDRVAQTLAADDRLPQRGLAVIDVRVVGVKADAELERNLQTPARERVQAESDRATYERRGLAVDRERVIAENELANQIELARREEQLVTRRGQNDRQRATELAAAEAIAAQAAAERDRLAAEVATEQQRLLAVTAAEGEDLQGAALARTATLIGHAEAETQAATLEAYREVDPTLVLALAVRELAGQLPAIGTLHLTPDLLGDLFGRLGTGEGAP
ncbi:SPFH domain-containing protein [soil metagenome]